MATRPLTPLVQEGWYSKRAYTWEKKGGFGGVVQHTSPRDFLTYNEAEIRELHTWLGKVVEDLDAGV